MTLDELAASGGMKLRTASDEDQALEDLHHLGCTDGLPVIVPTEKRVERMILAGGLAADLSLGTIGPLDGSATVIAIAICAVMAGCKPDNFPVVLASAGVLCDPMLDIGEVQATTHCAGPMVIVNGPARFDCGPFESGTGALGPGNRANATVGRAIRLCLVNIGGGRPGIGDMALIGQPGKFTFCLAEAEELSPYPPLHTRLGYLEDQSVVTLINVEAPHSVLCKIGGGKLECAQRLLRQLASAVGNPASNNINVGTGEVVVILNPEHARILHESGFAIGDLKEQIALLARKPRRALFGAPRVPDENLDELQGVSSDQLLVMVAGGGGSYSMVAPSWGAGIHNNRHASAEVRYGEACEIPMRMA
jgi:hypothetical protein